MEAATSAVMMTAHHSMTPILSPTTRMLVMQAVKASESLSRIVGSATTVKPKTSAANTPPTRV